MAERSHLPTHTGKAIHWQHCPKGAAAFAISEACLAHDGPILVIAADAYHANTLRHECQFFLDNSGQPYEQLTLEDWETLPYDHFSPHQDITSSRLKTLSKLPSFKRGVLVTTISTALVRLAPQQHCQQVFALSVGDKLNLAQFRDQCTQAGYYAVPQVMAHGEFAVRGEIIDLFPMGFDAPVRIGLFDDEVESLRYFDVDDQRTTEKVESLVLLPAHEFPMDENGISHFRQQWRERFSADPLLSPVYQSISEGKTIGGIEYYLPLFFNHTETLFDYLPDNTCVIFVGDVTVHCHQFLNEVQERYEQCRGDITRPLLDPELGFMTESEFFKRAKSYLQVKCHDGNTSSKPQFDIHCESLPDISVNPHSPGNRFAKLSSFLASLNYAVLFLGYPAARADQLKTMLNVDGIVVKRISTLSDFDPTSTNAQLMIGNLTRGFIDHHEKRVYISENDLFGEPVYQTKKRQKQIDPALLFKSLAELTTGSPVVHRNHGVGRYAGLQTMSVNEETAEYLIIEYAENDKLYVPVANLDCISRYSGIDLEHAPLHRLGGPEWEKLKKKASKRAHDVAAELLQLYALRANRQGHVFEIDNAAFIRFTEEFPFEETQDQTKTIQSIVDDMRSERPMDRLVCGDVGFGKTEVAMRAAFIAAMNGKQVAMLVPTTLLAQQHVQTFKDRFSQWPIRIVGLSRLSTSKEHKNAIVDIEAGKIDIVIGTHKLLQSDIQFKALQLVIIDEEHRFGVRQKEYLKSLRAEVDILSLTATPIPRTLNMAMAGIRDLSIISTPPSKRLAIRTFVHEYNPSMIREAIQREMMRGGQVFYLHNNIDTIEATAQRIQELVPDAKVVFAHGQMRERELERVMTAFYHHQYNILVCTTIIETGIDIPSANTMIIERADKFGLAQLHQLRGRVGRSHHQAYAYLITPPVKAITSDAKKRLEAIAQFDDLSVGFSLATLDLEIRGAGDFLGDGQSGHIEEIGFTLYQELLDKSIKALKEGKLPSDPDDNTQAEINLPLTTLFPDDYIPDIHTRLMLYKRLADTETEEALIDFKLECQDRFGQLPQAALDLIEHHHLKLRCQALGIKKCDVGYQYITLELAKDCKLNQSKIISLIQSKPKQYQLAGQSALKVKRQSTEKGKLFSELNQLIESMIC